MLKLRSQTRFTQHDKLWNDIDPEDSEAEGESPGGMSRPGFGDLL